MNWLDFGEITFIAVWNVYCQETQMDVGRQSNMLFQKTIVQKGWVRARLG